MPSRNNLYRSKEKTKLAISLATLFALVPLMLLNATAYPTDQGTTLNAILIGYVCFSLLCLSFMFGLRMNRLSNPRYNFQPNFDRSITLIVMSLPLLSYCIYALMHTIATIGTAAITSGWGGFAVFMQLLLISPVLTVGLVLLAIGCIGLQASRSKSPR